VFSQGPAFDYGVTLSDAVDMPINLGMQFVPAGRYANAIAFLGDVIAVYPFNETFIAGQVGLQLLGFVLSVLTAKGIEGLTSRVAQC
jgi:hypothetical protein